MSNIIVQYNIFIRLLTDRLKRNEKIIIRYFQMMSRKSITLLT